MNSMFELATIDEIDKLKNTGSSGDSDSDELNVEDLEVPFSFFTLFSEWLTHWESVTDTTKMKFFFHNL